MSYCNYLEEIEREECLYKACQMTDFALEDQCDFAIYQPDILLSPLFQKHSSMLVHPMAYHNRGN